MPKPALCITQYRGLYDDEDSLDVRMSLHPHTIPAELVAESEGSMFLANDANREEEGAYQEIHSIEIHDGEQFTAAGRKFVIRIEEVS